MINTLLKTLQIDICYAVNSFIYSLKSLPLFKDLLTNDAYQSKALKIILGTIGIISSFFRALFFKFIYFGAIYLISGLAPISHLSSFIHIYFILTILGMFINNKALTTSTKKYFSIILFNMDANKFLKSTIIWNTITNLVPNFIFLSLFIGFLKVNTLSYTLMLVLITISIRYIGEALNILFYRKNKYIWYSNSKLYFPIVLILLGVALLPFIKLSIPVESFKLTTIISLILGFISLIYLFRIKDFKLLYKKIANKAATMTSENEKDYLKQTMLEVKEKDKKIDNSILEKKEGYDLFNTIFFMRHKEILLRSAKKYALTAAIIYIVLFFIMIKYPSYNKTLGEFLHLKLSFFIIIMFFFNRGQVITQAMFFNCDHAMLSFNFYREPKVMLELFKKRLTTVVKVNLIPAVVIGLGNAIILILSGNNYTVMTIVTTFLFIIFLSVFFSVHYLVIYYLLQPYNQEMKVKKMSYSIVTLLTYVISYELSDLVMSSAILSVIGIIFVICYVSLSLVLVYKVSPRTFKLN